MDEAVIERVRELIKLAKEDGLYKIELPLTGPDPWATFRTVAQELRREKYRVNGRDETTNNGDEHEPLFVTITYLTVSWRP